MEMELGMVHSLSSATRQLLVGSEPRPATSQQQDSLQIPGVVAMAGIVPYWQAEGVLAFHGRSVDLREKQKIRQLFALFLDQFPRPVTRKQLLQEIYGYVEQPDRKASQRLANSHKHNALKLLSRSRIFAAENFDQQIGGYDVHWFPHDPFLKTWPILSLRKTLSDSSTDSLKRVLGTQVGVPVF